MAEKSSWLERILAAFGSGQSSPPTWHERVPNEQLSKQDQFLIESLPFHCHVVSGANALAEWERLRIAGDGYPVIVGDNDSLLRLAEAREFDDREVAEILGAANALQMPDAMEALRKHEHEQALDYLRSQGRVSDLENFHETPVGDWPEDQDELSQRGPAIVYDALEQRTVERVTILVLPTAHGFEVPAHLRYGAWNECPSAEYHVAALRSWQQRYGAELVSLGGDIVEVRVKRRPETRKEALALAREHYAYCNDTVDQGANDLATLATILMASDWWYFWWD